MTTDPKHHRWFDLGAAKFRGTMQHRGHELPNVGEPVYVCPLCVNSFTRHDLVEGKLTAEHVPPKKIKGKTIVLTCKRCNNKQGSEIDKHAKLRERWVDTMTGVRITPFAAEHTVGGVTARVETYTGPGQMGIAYIPKRNNPNEHEGYAQALADRANADQHITIHGGFDWEKANLSAIRAAYLASFAVFGYRHALRPSFLPLLRRLQGLDDQLPETILRYDPEETSKDNKMLLVTEPGPQQGILLVQMGRSAVVLPGPDDHRTLQEASDALAELVPDGGSRTLRGLQPDWPTHPEHRLDPNPTDEAGAA